MPADSSGLFLVGLLNLGFLTNQDINNYGNHKSDLIQACQNGKQPWPDYDEAVAVFHLPSTWMSSLSFQGPKEDGAFYMWGVTWLLNMRLGVGGKGRKGGNTE